MLLAVVAHDAALLRPTADGSTQRAHWTAAAKQGSVTAQRALDGPPFPDALDYLYDWFCEVSAGRGEGMHGAAPITYEQIAAWARLTDQHPAPHEVTALLALDAAWRAAVSGTTAAETAETATEARRVLAWPAPKAVSPAVSAPEPA